MPTVDRTKDMALGPAVPAVAAEHRVWNAPEVADRATSDREEEELRNLRIVVIDRIPDDAEPRCHRIDRNLNGRKRQRIRRRLLRDCEQFCNGGPRQARDIRLHIVIETVAAAAR